ncbi:hypothetical protein EDL96_07975 [Kocuria soli]|uniref:O-antigen ligase domain-containing protein n=1 Tax=Kocuria soli TaxID=2485125 RepID=A0A3N3ZPS0_9MICC|nr:hypothetical protein EDL96_07975 [Kocuria soli]
MTRQRWLRAVRAEKTRWPTAVLGFFLVMDGSTMPWWPTTVPPAQLALAGLAALVLLRITPPTRGTRLLAIALGCVLGSVLLSTLSAGHVEAKRLGTVFAWALVMYGVARGSVSIASLARGIGLGLFVGLVYGVVFWSSSLYENRLTGVLGDPNTAGLALATLGPLAVVFLRHRWTRVALALTVLTAVILTASRTSMFALAVAGVLILLAHKLHPVVVAGLLWLAVWWLSSTAHSGTAETFFDRGYFADREGSDHLRSMLAPLEEQKRLAGGWFGHGPGEAYVVLGNDFQMFSHDSYSAFQMEFGKLGVVALVLLALTLLLRQLHRGGYLDPLMNWPVAACGVVLVCSTNLGESLLTPSAAVAAGALVLVSRHARRRRPPTTRPERPPATGGRQEAADTHGEVDTPVADAPWNTPAPWQVGS